ncbi:MAG: hypothetical protein JWM32_49 [Verrucomicrobia bacterium]|nr:hypothetical protein [Verrucomicrobiota bacterium]
MRKIPLPNRAGHEGSALLTPVHFTLPLRLSFALLCAFSFGPILHATTVRPPTFPELVNQSDCIVRAVVKSVEARKQTTPHGFKIYTYVELTVLEVIAGQPATPLVLRVLGGKVDGDEIIFEGAPRFKPGEENILFIQANGTQVFPLVALGYGRYPVLRDPATGDESVLRSDGSSLRSTAEIGLPLKEPAAGSIQAERTEISTPLTVAQFVRQIRSAVAPSNSRLREKN